MAEGHDPLEQRSDGPRRIGDSPAAAMGKLYQTLSVDVQASPDETRGMSTRSEETRIRDPARDDVRNPQRPPIVHGHRR
jgi:hypothetical protein